jgi:putative isomerase
MNVVITTLSLALVVRPHNGRVEIDPWSVDVGPKVESPGVDSFTPNEVRRFLDALVWTLVMIVCFGCAGAAPPSRAPISRDAFADLIDHRGVPTATEDWDTVPFSDQGAWFGFGLPTMSGQPGVGFTGPFLMTSGRWISPQLVRLEIPGAELVQARALPGLLETVWRAGEVTIEQQLWFDSSLVAMIRTEMLNSGAVPWAWNGDRVVEAFDPTVVLEDVDGDRLIMGPEGERLRVLSDVFPGEEVRVEPGGSATSLIAVSMTPPGDPEPKLRVSAADAEASLTRNAARWEAYLDSTAVVGPPDQPASTIAVKAVETLINNWRRPAGRFEHGGLFPSSNVWYFNGFWAWDSWKHAAALARFAPEIAADQLRLMAAQQNDDGMIADVVYLDPAEDNWRNTKPPLLGWALGEVFEATGDLDLVRELYPRLVRYHEFWYRYRDHDGDGLCEYGSTDGTIEAARWESGMDNAVRFDSTEMLPNGPAAWSMDQESVDLNSFLYRDKLALRDLAAVLERTDDARHWDAEAEHLRELIRSTMYDETTGWFYDTAIDTGEFVAVRGPEGWIPLWAEVATDEQAARVRETMLDPAVFRTHVPFPTVAADHPEFSDGYWRGLVWLDQVWFAIEGLRAYGHSGDAEALTAQLLANLEGASAPGEPLYENYDPLTGEGRNVRHFSWTAGHLLLLASAAANQA